MEISNLKRTVDFPLFTQTHFLKQYLNLEDGKVSFDNVRHLEDDALFEIRYRFCITDDKLPQEE